MQNLKVNEIFYSIQGESNTIGYPTIFVRLTGCPIRCSYCDTTYSFYEGHNLSFDEILNKISVYDCEYVLITGGEPLAQKDTMDLLSLLCNKGFKVSIETGGMLDITHIDPRVSIVLDIKTPSSHESHNNLISNYSQLKKNDQIKFVICDYDDFIWSRDIIREFDLSNKCELIFSPSYGEVANKDLAQWILNEELPVRFQIQLHKVLWGDSPGK